MNDRAPDLDRDFALFCRSADPDALGRVFDSTAGQLLRIALWLCGNRADAEDAVQRAFLVAIEQRTSFRRGNAALPWLLGLLTNQAHKVRRERARRGVPVAVPAGEPDPAARAAGAELEEAIDGTVQSLGPSYHDVLHLHLREGLAAHEIAQRLGRPAGTVRTQIVRGVQELRRRLPTGFVGGLAPAWFPEPIRIATSVREVVLAAAKAQHAAVAGTAAFTSRAGVLLAVLAATVVVGIGLAWLLPGRRAVAPVEPATATAGIDAPTGARGSSASPHASIAAEGRAPDAAPAPAGPPLAREAVAAAPAAAGAELRVRVRDAGTRPLADARVWLCNSTWSDGSSNEHAAFTAATTGDDGVARFAAPMAALDTIVVLANGRRPAQLARGIPSGEQDVVIDQQLSITGIVIVDGGRPGEPIELVARGGASEAGWCDAARAALTPFDPTEGAGYAIADAAGRYAFFGLAANIEHAIAPLVRAFKRPDTNRSEPVVTATPLAVGVVLELARLPVIRGRTVLQPGTPTAGKEQVWILPRFISSKGGYTEWGATRCRVGEQFTIAVMEDDSAHLERTELEFRLGRSRASTVVAARSVPCPFTGVHDIGDVVLEDASSECELQIVDRNGAPIAGARALSLGKLSAPTGDDGIVRVVVGPPPAQLGAGAVGYRFRAIDAAEASRTVRVVLEPANRLRIEARAADERTPLPRMFVTLAFADIPAGYEIDDAWLVSELRGAKLAMASYSGNENGRHFHLPAGAPLELNDLPAAMTFEVRLGDPYGHEIAKERVTLGADERRDVRFVVSLAARRLGGQVVDADGHPLRGVAVSVGEYDPDDRVTDADGRFAIENVYSEAPSLRFDKQGFRQLSVSGPDLFERTTFRLERAN
ncbi:MAG TPA: sigma-70 family RNA polymerase sigma factor [Planctomycetota bacterium]